LTILSLDHCKRAISDVATFGDNDVVPFDVDTKFVAEKGEQLADAILEVGHSLERKTRKDCKSTLHGVQIFSERLLAPVGQSGFRIATKIHPFWNLYLNSISVALAERHEPQRLEEAYSYRFSAAGPGIFDKEATWRKFRGATLLECDNDNKKQVAIQTDISSFYEHIYHHRLQNFVDDLVGSESNISVQVDVILNQIAMGRSFGLPVGGQASRVLSEVILSSVDRTLKAEGINFARYVDDFVLFSDSQQQAYEALGVLAHALGDFGLSLNRSKTNLLSAKHYKELVETQLSAADGEARKLKEIDLHFDPYSDTATTDYEDLKQTVDQIDLARLIALELDKGQPDNFVVRQIARSLALLEPENALGIAASLLDQRNIHAFRASWSTIMRGIAHLRAQPEHVVIHERLDRLLDQLPRKVPYLLYVDTNVLHFLRTLRFRRTPERATYILSIFKKSRSSTVRRACIDCWRQWKDRDRFLSLRNEWANLGAGEQRMLWLAAPYFGDDGMKFRMQVRRTIDHLWGLGLQSSTDSFVSLFLEWSENVSEI
jgi:hypothetical protein